MKESQEGNKQNKKTIVILFLIFIIITIILFIGLLPESEVNIQYSDLNQIDLSGSEFEDDGSYNRGTITNEGVREIIIDAKRFDFSSENINAKFGEKVKLIINNLVLDSFDCFI